MKNDIDLVPREYRAAHALRRKLAGWGRLACLLSLAIGALALPIRWRLAKLEKGNAALRAIIEQGPGIPVQLAEVEASIQSAYERYRIYHAYLKEPDWTAVLSNLGAATGERLWLQRLSIVKGEETPGAPPAHKAVIEGFAPADEHIVEFMRNLNRGKMFAKLELKGTTVAPDRNIGSAVHFTLTSDIQ